MFTMIFKIFLLVLLKVCFNNADRPVVETPLGLIKGYNKVSYNGRTFTAFEGIPFAKPPIGQLRFKEPQPIEAWTGTWDANTTHTCMQIRNEDYQIIDGDEDCLYLSVYVPKIERKKNDNLDVIVHIHGGAFMYGNPASLSGPEFLMDRDIVFVNLNYRLGILGFLSTEDDVVPGNNGMKDQVLAMKWVKDHIRAFGGNPDSITLVGVSAGGTAVHLHYFSSLSKGLFNRGISHSGTALVPWAIQEAPLEKARKIAAELGCNYVCTEKFINCIRERPASQVVKSTNVLFDYPGFPLSPFAVVIEKKSKTAFLDEQPYQKLISGNIIDVPWITSIASAEGIFPVVRFHKKLDEIEQRWNEIMPSFLEYNFTVRDGDKKKVAEKVKKFYVKDQKISKDAIQDLIKLFGDRYFNIGFEKAARLQTKINKSPVYTYIYDYVSEFSIGTILDKTAKYGVAHADESLLIYYVSLYGITFVKNPLNENDEKVKDILIDYITTFAANGTPQIKTANWEPLKRSGDFNYLLIKNPNHVKITSAKEIAPIKFWESLPIMEDENLVLQRDEL